MDEREERLMAIAVKTANAYRKSLDIIAAEKLVFNEELGLAGTIDLLARSKKDKSIVILDWKTNKRIIKESPFGKYGLKPISHLMDINFNHYSLQLSIYQYLLSTTGYFPPDTKYRRALIHLTEFQAIPIGIPYLGKELSDMLTIFKSKHRKH